MKHRRRLFSKYTGWAAVALFIVIGGGVLWLRSFDASLELSTLVNRYVDANLKPSPQMSRRWMTYTMQLQKKENFAPATAARLYAYVSGVFYDSLEKTHSLPQASAATAALLDVLLPTHTEETRTFLTMLYGYQPSVGAAQTVLEQYVIRSKTDHFELKWSGNMIPPGSDYWYARGGEEDGGAMAGQWTPWLVEDMPLPPAPPVRGSIADTLELEKVKYATVHRLPAQIQVIYFWQGSSGFVKGTKKDNITPSGVWQDILYVEEPNLSDEAYARAQNILAQTVADAFIHTWRAKYTFYTQRPSMRIDSLAVALADPPFPGYISGHSSISKAAAVVLSALFPEKENIWTQNARDARYSRLLAGIHFDIDNAVGEAYGAVIGEAAVQKLGLKNDAGSVSEYHAQSSLVNLFELAVLRTNDTLVRLYPQSVFSWLVSLSSNIHFTDTATAAGILSNASPYAVWFDYNHDGQQDLLLERHLYQGMSDGTFVDVTATAGLTDILDPAKSRTSDIVSADYDNDGCPDLLVLENANHKLKLLHNNCKGAFTDVTGVSGLSSGQAQGAAWDDYDHDGYLDLYIANWLQSSHPSLFQGSVAEKNMLWHNNGNGTFTNVTDRAGVSGFPDCPNYPPRKYIQSQSKNSFQPIWFDFNNDGYDDLFVATDTWISPLYRNNGDGTFTDVTYKAGLCTPGTGMGVAVTDLDHNGYQDLYVSNTGSNYLWMNQGNGTFKEEAASRGVANPGQGWGVIFADLDNDGDQDLYVANGTINSDEAGSGNPGVDRRNLDAVYENSGGYFRDVTVHAGVSGSWFKQAAAAADYNHDGKVDIYVAARAHPQGLQNSFYRNTSPSGHYLEVSLTGVQDNRDAIGATIEVTAGTLVQKTEVLNSSSFFSQHSLVQHFGLGSRTKVDTVTVVWPSGKVQQLSDVPADKMLSITETP